MVTVESYPRHAMKKPSRPTFLTTGASTATSMAEAG